MTREEAIEFIAQSVKSDVDMAKVADAIKALEQEPCEDAISREKARQFLYERLDRLNDDELYDIFSRIIDDMYNELPSVTPQPKTGRWIYTLEDWNKWECSECGYTKRTDVHVSIGYKFCPNCGAKMESEEVSQQLKTVKAIKMREATPEERESINKYIKSISKPTGVSFWNSEQEPCEDAISRILKRMWNCRGKHTTSIDKVKMEQIIRDDLPSVTPQPKTVRWIFDDKCKEHGHCSECGYGSIDLIDGKPHRFCQNCGAKMELESEVEVCSSNFIQLKQDVLNNKQLWRKLREIEDEDSD